MVWSLQLNTQERCGYRKVPKTPRSEMWFVRHTLGVYATGEQAAQGNGWAGTRASMAAQLIRAVMTSLSYNTGYGQRYQESRDSGITAIAGVWSRFVLCIFGETEECGLAIARSLTATLE